MKLEKIVFAVSVVVFFVLFGGLNGHSSTLLACGLGLGFLIGRNWYAPDEETESKEDR